LEGSMMYLTWRQLTWAALASMGLPWNLR